MTSPNLHSLAEVPVLDGFGSGSSHTIGGSLDFDVRLGADERRGPVH